MMTIGITQHVAIDLGASNGRVALGTLQGGQLQLEVLHRFPNAGLWLPAHGHLGLYWDVHGFWREILHGLRLAAHRGPIASIGVDTWSNDFALLDEYDCLIDGVHHYRDPRTNNMREFAARIIPHRELFFKTGVHSQPFNTLYHLLAIQRRTPQHLTQARSLLMLPDLLHFWLTGIKVGERTNVSSTQIYDPLTGDWASEILDDFALPKQILPPIVDPGTLLGPLTPEVTQLTGLHNTVIVVPGTHDTASAVAATPLADAQTAYISSGTWSLVGLETPQPILSSTVLEAKLTNEAGVFGTNRLICNVMGLWIVQECRRAWGNPDYATLYQEADQAAPHQGWIDPDDPRFYKLGDDMPQRIAAYCAETGQRLGQTRGAVVRCILESLALKYRTALDRLTAAIGHPVKAIQIVGGGALITPLCQWTADATGLPVTTGPVDATVIGNLLIQAQSLGLIRQEECRQVVRHSFPQTQYWPHSSPAWVEAQNRFQHVLAQGVSA